MLEKEIVEEQESEIDLIDLFIYLKNHLYYIVVSILVCSILTGVFTVFFVSKKYQASARIYVKPEVIEGTVNASDISANNMMVNNYVELLKGNNIQGQVANKLETSIGAVSGATSVTNQDSTQIIVVSATTTDPALSKDMVDTTIDVFKAETKETLSIDNIITVDETTLPTSPVSPSLKKNLLMGGLVGLILSCGILVLMYMLDTHVHNGEDAEKYLGVPNLGTIPYFED